MPDPFDLWSEQQKLEALQDILYEKASGKVTTSLGGDGGNYSKRVIRSLAQRERDLRYSLWLNNPSVYTKPPDLRMLVARFRDR